jgi:uncharacterized protein
VFSTGEYAIGLTAALIIGLSKTAFPGAGLIATPLLAMVFSGRPIAGAALPILMLADLFAVRWYRDDARFDLLTPLIPWVAIGFAAGASFFILIGKANRSFEIIIAVMILSMVLAQVVRALRQRPPAAPSTGAAALFGTAGGFTTFVSNNAGPVMNAHFIRLGLDKRQLVGTSSWFYFVVNAAKLPIYLVMGRFFTRSTLKFDLVAAPAVVVGVLVGRRLFPHVPQKVFMWVVLALAAGASIKLLVG